MNNRSDTEVTIHKTIGLGDAGLPFDVSIDVTFEKKGNQITVTDWMENECPYDNPSEKWYERMKEIISDYFYELDNNNDVSFKI